MNRYKPFTATGKKDTKVLMVLLISLLRKLFSEYNTAMRPGSRATRDTGCPKRDI